MGESKSLTDILGILKKYTGVIIALTLTAILISAVASYYFVKPIYQASTQILVNQNQPGTIQVNSYDNAADLRLINTYSVIIKSPAILNQVIEELNLNTTNVLLNEKITVNTAEESQVVNINVRDGSPSDAVHTANSIAAIFQTEIKEIMRVDNVRILSPAVLPENPEPVEPQPILNMVLAGLIGLSSGIGFAFLMHYLDTTIKKDEDIKETLDIPVLGIISIFPGEDKVKEASITALKREEV
ncbi:YveK family protein [Planococcus glaciei]|uniref:YveK family protein n=1 Tax=Planococcus glaciei TaxID=459472 RepID=UPI001C72AA9F|nr:Wzz/FepE/Etk N-terminal domain-containing protein [Planococcus glaciei]MBX0313320.1 capsular biosynthesis protein [Planococcus glaciei]